MKEFRKRTEKKIAKNEVLNIFYAFYFARPTSHLLTPLPDNQRLIKIEAKS